MSGSELLAGRRVPIVGAPMAGGISTPQLVAAVSQAGGLGFVPAGYLSVERAAEELDAVRALTDHPFGLNIFVPGLDDADEDELDRYASTLLPEAERLGVELGQQRFDDDAYSAKVALALQARPAAVSFTFGCPSHADAQRLREAGTEVWVTVTSVSEARAAAEAGAQVLVAQGIEAGGHRGRFQDQGIDEGQTTADLVASIVRKLPLPIVAAGGIMTVADVSAARAAGAVAVQLGTALMLTPEAGTAPAHREAFMSSAGTRLTRAFTGRTARAIVNRFMEEHDHDAVRGYPEVHYITAPIRAAAKRQGDASALHLWAGQRYRLASPAPVADVIAQLSAS